MTRTTYYAHSADGQSRDRWHSLSAHLQSTGDRAAAFLAPVGCADLGRIAGLLHDLGKYSAAFQRRLAGDASRVDHSTAGALIARERYPRHLAKILAFCIAGHHAGLANGRGSGKATPLADRLRASVPDLDPVWESEVPLPKEIAPLALKPRSPEMAGFSVFMLTRMVFSALVDADYLDTERYYDGIEGRGSRRGRHPSLADLSTRLDRFLDGLAGDADPTPVNRLRRRVLARVRERAPEPPGPFSFTVPTGGGKTLSSLAFALDHAKRHGLERVIYVIPFTSVVEQTVDVFRKALAVGDGDEADFVVEHHSAFDEDSVRGRESRDKLRLAMENWDAPIIVTTAVQFFESLFANRPSRSRKVHRIANSVVILDEAQTLPLPLLRPCVAALDELSRNWRTTTVLCTATQPALGEADGFEGGFWNLRELAPDPISLYDELRRTTIRRWEGRLPDDELADRLRGAEQVLCIVNTRRHARDLFGAIREAEGARHLTTAMCAAHRREVLKEIKARLRAGEPVRLVATSLVEAGVDLDFPVVWRAAAGLESVIQAAGRCNREGRRVTGEVWVFEPEGHEAPAQISQFADSCRSVLRRYNDDPVSLRAIRAYFREIYWIQGDSLDAKDILPRIRERRTGLDFPFEDIARDFRVIEDTMAPVVVPWAPTAGCESPVRGVLRDLEQGQSAGLSARRLQPFVVPVPHRARRALVDAGAASPAGGDREDRQFTVLDNLELYDSRTGLSWDDPTYRSAESLIF